VARRALPARSPALHRPRVIAPVYEQLGPGADTSPRDIGCAESQRSIPAERPHREDPRASATRMSPRPRAVSGSARRHPQVGIAGGMHDDVAAPAPPRALVLELVAVLRAPALTKYAPVSRASSSGKRPPARQNGFPVRATMGCVPIGCPVRLAPTCLAVAQGPAKGRHHGPTWHAIFVLPTVRGLELLPRRRPAHAPSPSRRDRRSLPTRRRRSRTPQGSCPARAWSSCRRRGRRSTPRRCKGEDRGSGR